MYAAQCTHRHSYTEGIEANLEEQLIERAREGGIKQGMGQR